MLWLTWIIFPYLFKIPQRCFCAIIIRNYNRFRTQIQAIFTKHITIELWLRSFSHKQLNAAPCTFKYKQVIDRMHIFFYRWSKRVETQLKIFVKSSNSIISSETHKVHMKECNLSYSCHGDYSNAKCNWFHAQSRQFLFISKFFLFLLFLEIPSLSNDASAILILHRFRQSVKLISRKPLVF